MAVQMLAKNFLRSEIVRCSNGANLQMTSCPVVLNGEHIPHAFCPEGQMIH